MIEFDNFWALNVYTRCFEWSKLSVPRQSFMLAMPLAETFMSYACGHKLL